MVNQRVRKVFDPLDLTKKLEDKVTGNKPKQTPVVVTPVETTNAMAMGEEEAKKRRMRAAGGGTILGNVEGLGG